MRDIESLPVSKPEACTILQVSASKIERMLKTGELRVVRIGRRCLVCRKSLERLLQGESTPNDAEEAVTA